MTSMKAPTAQPMPMKGKKAMPMTGYANGGVVGKTHNPDNQLAKMVGYANGGMIASKIDEPMEGFANGGKLGNLGKHAQK